MFDFSHLHTHSEFSIFDGCAKIEKMLKKIKENKMEFLAITDHHNVYSWFFLEKYAKNYDVKPIYGMELNVDKHHLVGVAINDEGITNLLKLNNVAYEKKRMSKITEKELEKNCKGIYFLSGCSKGKIPHLIYQGKREEALKEAKKYKEIFDGNFAIEIQSYQLQYNKRLAKELISIAKQSELMIVPTNDSHYVNSVEHFVHHQLVSMHTSGKVKLSNTQNYLKTKEEMKKLFPENILKNAGKIGALCNANFTNVIKKQKGEIEIPLSMLYYYDDAEALKDAFFSQKKYALGQFLYKKMKKENLTLETLPLTQELYSTIEFAYGLRNKLCKIEADPYYYIKVGKYFPIWKRKKDGMISAQIDYFNAQNLGFEIHDKRKTVSLLS